MNHPTRELLVCIELSLNETHHRVCGIKACVHGHVALYWLVTEC